MSIFNYFGSPIKQITIMILWSIVLSLKKNEIILNTKSDMIFKTSTQSKNQNGLLSRGQPCSVPDRTSLYFVYYLEDYEKVTTSSHPYDDPETLLSKSDLEYYI